MKHECKQEKVIDMIATRLNNIDNKLDSLMRFRWQIMGGAGVLGTLAAFIINKLWS